MLSPFAKRSWIWSGGVHEGQNEGSKKHDATLGLFYKNWFINIKQLFDISLNLGLNCLNHKHSITKYPYRENIL